MFVSSLLVLLFLLLLSSLAPHHENRLPKYLKRANMWTSYYTYEDNGH